MGLGLAAAVVVLGGVTGAAAWARLADEDDTIIDYWPADPPADPTALGAHVEASIEAGGGFEQAPGPPLVFELHDDGSVFTGTDDSGNPFGLVRYRLTPAGTEKARELLAGIDLDDAAYGEPQITDMPTTTVRVERDGTVDDVSVYALAHLDDMGDLGLSGPQQDVRHDLADTLDALTALVDDAELVAELPAPYTPERIDVAFVPWVVDTGEGGTAPDPRDWPLATPLTERRLGWEALRVCATVEDAEAATLTRAMAITSPGAQERPWTTGARVASAQPTAVAVQVTGLRPGQPACVDRPNPASTTEPPQPPQVDAGPLYAVELSDPTTWDGGFAAEDFRQAAPLEVDAAVPALAAAAADDPGLQLNTSDLSWYDYRAVVAVDGGTSYVDIEAQPTAGSTPDAGEPTTWRVRIDLTTAEVVAVEAG